MYSWKILFERFNLCINLKMYQLGKLFELEHFYSSMFHCSNVHVRHFREKVLHYFLTVIFQAVGTFPALIGDLFS